MGLNKIIKKKKLAFAGVTISTWINKGKWQWTLFHSDISKILKYWDDIQFATAMCQSTAGKPASVLSTSSLKFIEEFTVCVLEEEQIHLNVLWTFELHEYWDSNLNLALGRCQCGVRSWQWEYKKNDILKGIGRDQKNKNYQEREGMGELTESRDSQWQSIMAS